MKIVSWNVNGIRALCKNGNFTHLRALEPDVITLQETKATAEQIPPEAQIPGFYSYFTAPVIKKGYSGVGVYSRTEPLDVRYGIGIESLDQEGRTITLEFNNWFFIGCYFPNGGGGEERFLYKLDFYDGFLDHISKLQRTGKGVVFAGDVNAAHHPIDLARPLENEGTPGYRPEVREWIDVVERSGYVDSFRSLHPGESRYSYWDMKTRARDRDIGWRIDYIFVSQQLAPRMVDAQIHTQIYGSDHCPISATIDF
jgi:exodeoxyribonuclease-3